MKGTIIYKASEHSHIKCVMEGENEQVALPELEVLGVMEDVLEQLALRLEVTPEFLAAYMANDLNRRRNVHNKLKWEKEQQWSCGVY